MNPSALVVIILAFLSNPSQVNSNHDHVPNGQGCEPSSDDAEVYSKVIQETLLKNEDGKARVVLYDQTSAGYPPGMAAWTSMGGKEGKELMDAATAETKSDFDAKAKLHCALAANIEPRERIVFLNAKQEESLFPNGGGSWEAFRRKYPHATGFTLLSAIGFNKAHDQAFVYLGNSCGMLCGGGYFVLLEKKDGKWVVMKTANIWVS